MSSYDLDTPLLDLGEGVEWTARNGVEGTQIFGGIGSGKTSGSGEFIAKKFLENGYGGLVLSVKPGELVENWIPYCRETRRLDDLVVLKPDGDQFFNFIDYELNREGDGVGRVDNLANTLKTVLNASKQGQTSGNDEFWQDALDMLLFSVLDLCYMAYGDYISLDKISAVVNSIPINEKQYEADDARRDRNKKAPNAQQYQRARNAFFQAFETYERQVSQIITSAKVAYKQKHPDKDSDVRKSDFLEYRSFRKVWDYFKETYMPLNPRTKSIIDHMVKGLFFRLSRDPVYSLMCSNKSTVTPESCLDGKIIFLDLPVKEYDKVGRDAQILFKYIWQRAMERRNVHKDGGRPVFLWADEAQNFLHEHDIDYQATARSSRVCTVYLTQNLPNYFAHLGGREGEYQVKSFLGTMGTKIFHANADMETNKYASDLFGDVLIEKKQRSFQSAGEYQMSETSSLDYDQAVRPEKFVSLKTGGNKNNHIVQGFLHRQGTPMQWLNNEGKSFRRNYKFIQLKQSNRS